MTVPSLAAPVDKLSEVEPLLAAGASWLYGGALPRDYARRFPAIVPLNQRTFASAQFPALPELGEAISLTRARGGSFALVLNAPFYLAAQVPVAVELASFAASRGAAAAIVGDPGLLRVLRREVPSLDLHLSVMGLAHNPEAASLMAEEGATRIILPRHLALAEISSLTGFSPPLEWEAFLLVGRCPNVEGVCSFLHDSPRQSWPCEWEYAATSLDGGPLDPGLVEAFAPLPGADRRDACGLCALPQLLAAGVTCFKIVGRGAPTARKLSLVRAAAALAAAGEGKGGEEWRRSCGTRYQGLFGRPCSRRSCYYPEVWMDGETGGRGDGGKGR